ncbi:spermatogenesis-associated protein 32 isoform X2 [Manis javanica]|uniref:spermatogenesis-associated protein 32 isoform X2 n=1 Tax=Manis javanica TaxID=9974 RepID=UPI00081371DC|nr:spermatogenesis-associated protein 32 [Manis javanica]
MGVTGASGFPCCCKESVDIVETQGNINQHGFQLVPDEDEMELDNELLELEPPDQSDLNVDPELETDVEPEPEDLPQPEAELDVGPKLKATPCNEDPWQQEYMIEPLLPHTEGLTLKDINQWSMRSDSSYLSPTEEDQLSTKYHSICVQTSKDLFWADKLIQASKHSLERAISTQPDKNNTDKNSHPDQQSVPTDPLCSKKQLQNPSAQPAPPTTDSQQPPSPDLSSSDLPPAIGLADLTTFMSCLPVAASSKMDLPSLEHVIEAPSQKAMDGAAQPALEQPGQGKLSKESLKEPLGAGEQQKAWKQEDKTFPHTYLDFSKLGIKKTTTEGEVKLLQSPTMSLLPQGDMKHSVPEIKKVNPLLLKIHLKLSNSPSPEN